MSPVGGACDGQVLQGTTSDDGRGVTPAHKSIGGFFVVLPHPKTGDVRKMWFRNEQRAWAYLNALRIGDRKTVVRLGISRFDPRDP